MDNNVTKSVFMPGELTAEEQYKLIKSNIKKAQPTVNMKQKPYASKVSGNSFFTIDSNLYEPKKIFVKSLKAGFNKSNLLLVTLLSTKPFYNFGAKMKNVLNEKVDDIEILYSICEVLNYIQIEKKEIPPNIDLGIEENDFDIFNNFDYILKILHENIVKKYFFVEDVWQDPSDLKIPKKVIESDFSPVVGLFHFEVLRALGKNKYEIETLADITVKCDGRKISEIIETMFSKKEKGIVKVKKMPHVFTVKISNFGMQNLCSQLKLGGNKYSFESCVFVNSKKEIGSIVELDGNFHEIKRESVNIKNELYFDDNLEELIVFYSAIDYDFD